MMVEGSKLPQEAARAEVAAYYAEGSIAFEEPADLINPTLFRGCDRYDLHYGSFPFQAFPLYASNYDAKLPLLTLCLDQLQEWITDVCDRRARLSWTFSIEDCCAFCAHLPRVFSVASTSNVADHVGLLPLLQAARRVVVDEGILLSESLLYLTYATSEKDYLHQNLVLDPAMWPSVLGWRCVGYEGSLAPLTSQVRLETPDIVSMLKGDPNFKSMFGGTQGKTRSETKFVWSCAPIPSAPLDLANVAGLAQLILSLRLQTCDCADFVPTCDRAVLVHPPSGNDGMNRLHLLSVLPVLAAGTNAEKLLQPDDVEILDLLAFMRGQSPCDLMVASVELSDAALAIDDPALASNEKLALMRMLGMSNQPLSPHLSVAVYHADKFWLYSGLWLTYESGHRRINWFVSKARVGASQSVRVLGSMCTLSSCSADLITLRSVPPGRFDSYIKPWLHAEPNRGGTHTSEDQKCWRTTVMLPKEAFSTTSPCVTAQNERGSTLVTLKIQNMEDLTLTYAGPIKNVTVDLCESRLEAIVIVRKVVYSAGSHSCSELWLDDEVSWVHRSAGKDFNPQFMQTVSGHMMSPSERIISRDDSGPTPPLIALKDSVMFFFQCSEEKVFQFELPEGGCHAISILHGLRQEHRTGTFAADVSFCFLQTEFLADVISWCQQNGLVSSAGKEINVRRILCQQDEFDLLKDVVAWLASRAKDRKHWSKNTHRTVIPSRLRQHFIRVLLPPLCAHAEELAEVHKNAAARRSALPALSLPVLLIGIGSRPELNGQSAYVQSYDPVKLRYCVRLEDGSSVNLLPTKVILPAKTIVKLNI